MHSMSGSIDFGRRSLTGDKNANSRYTKEQEKEMDNKIHQLTRELKETRQLLDSERAKVQEISATISKMKSNKFERETNMIASLQESQNELRWQIKAAIQSKIELCSQTSQELNRLRKIIWIGVSCCYC